MSLYRFIVSLLLLVTLAAQAGDFLTIPAGTTWIGSDPELLGTGIDNRTTARVPGFQMQETPVTVAEYCDFLNAGFSQHYDHRMHIVRKRGNNYRPEKGYADHPITFVSLHDALAYSDYLGAGLPAETQWLRAARGESSQPDSSLRYPWGKRAPTPEQCHLLYASGPALTTRAVTQTPELRFGLRELAGNVWEWTSTLKLISDTLHTDSLMIVKGGSWLSGELSARTGSVLLLPPDTRRADVGFRCVR